MVLEQEGPPLGQADGAEEDLRRKLQRDVNCLFDPDRNARRRSLTKIKKLLLDEPAEAPPAGVLCSFFSKHLRKALLQLVSDPVEKCRETAIAIMDAFTARALLPPQELAVLTAELVPLARSRVGVAPFAEPTEEIRLQLMQLLNSLLESQGGWQAVVEQKLMGDVAAIIARECLDSFPEVKREVCRTVAVVATRAPQELRLHQASILQALLTNLSHQHSKVRQVTLQAVGHLLSCGSDAMPRVLSETVLPQFKKLVFDRTPAIRKELSCVAAGWLRGEEQVAQHFKGCEPDLLLLVLMGLSDELDEVRGTSRQELQAMGDAWWARTRASSDIEPGPTAKEMQEEEEEESGRLTGIERMTRALLGSLVPKVLEDVAHWTLRLRHRSVLQLSHVVEYAGPAMVACLPPVLASLANATGDEEADVASAVEECGRALGRVVEAQALLDVLVPQVRGQRAGQATAQHRSSALLLLRSLLHGMPAGRLTAAQVGALSEALADTGVLECEGPAGEVGQLAEGSSLVVEALVQAAPEHCCGTDGQRAGVRGRLVRSLVQALAVPEAFGGAEDVRETARRGLRLLADGGEVEALLDAHFEEVVAWLRCQGPAEVWTKDAPRRMAFEALVREAQTGSAKHLRVVVPVLVTHLQPERDPEVRLAMMALLETVIARPASADALGPHTRAMVSDMILPNAVWKAGRVASTIRKVALVCLYTLLRDRRVPLPTLYETVPPLLPVLKTDLDDYDASSRQLVALSLEAIFLALPRAFDDEPIRQLYPELLKRLDDSSDDVRKSICGTLAAFLNAAAPEVFRGGILDYTLDQLFVHLDDQDPAIQDAVLRVLKAAAPIDPAMVEKKAQAARGSHRSPRYCDELLQALRAS